MEEWSRSYIEEQVSVAIAVGMGGYLAAQVQWRWWSWCIVGQQLLTWQFWDIRSLRLKGV